ncbi:MAG: phosphoribosylglycinamide formyltransferase [Gemmatimonadetes bacterium]|nr:phosphoribosylglycinamide formyltransferase [Gemmatimonadota bacterium]
MAFNPRLVVLASGRGSNFRAIADAIDRRELDAEIGLLISDNPGAPALEQARRRGIATHLLDCGERRGRMKRDSVDELLRLIDGADAVILAGFMRIVPKRVVEAHRGRILNIHPSLLPAFPGLNPQAQALEHGVRVSGCTVHLVDEGTDTGPILLQAAVEVRDDDTAASLSARILREEHRIYPRAIELLCRKRVFVDGRRIRILHPESAS